MADEAELLTERIPFHATKGFVEAIDDWRYANRVATRSKAIRLLVQRSLGHEAQAIDRASTLREVFGEEAQP